MVLDLLLTPFVLVAAVLFLFGAAFALLTGHFVMIRLCRLLSGHLPDFLRGGLIEEAMVRATYTHDGNNPVVANVEKLSAIGTVVAWLLFGSQLAMFVAYGAVFTAIGCFFTVLKERQSSLSVFS